MADVRAVYQGNVLADGRLGHPAINTALLLTSGITLTIAHHALIAGKRSKLITWLAATILLGRDFLSLQIYGTCMRTAALNLKLSTGIFGSTFFMLTGFHGFTSPLVRSCWQ